MGVLKVLDFFLSVKEWELSSNCCPMLAPVFLHLNNCFPVGCHNRQLNPELICSVSFICLGFLVFNRAVELRVEKLIAIRKIDTIKHF